VGAHYGLDKVFMPGDFIFFHDEVKENVVRNFFASVLISPSENDISVNAEDFFKARPPFRSALIKSVGEGKLTDEIAVLKKMNLPVQVIFGKEDSLLQIDYLDGQPFPFWRNNVFKLPGAGHFVHNDQSETLNNLLSEYLGELL
jgi:pimeloyl-ACP methyl ester carboxylesterase